MADIPNTEYITINKDGIFVGGKPATHYHGRKIAFVDGVNDDFAEMQKNYPQIAEFHVGAFEKLGIFRCQGKPSEKFGPNSWCRVKLQDGRVGPWVFSNTYSSDSACARNCAFYCGHHVVNYFVMRSSLLDFTKKGKVNAENKEKEQYETVNVIKSCKYRITIEKLKENTK